MIAALYWVFAGVALLNLLLMRRAKAVEAEGDPSLCVLIPARNEHDNLTRLVPALVSQRVKVYVYDDESSDSSAEAAADAGATVIRGGPVPDRWTGKNYACHMLAKAATEDSDAEWFLFLDADTYPGGGFVAGMAALCQQVPSSVGVVTGFARFIPGRGVQPLFIGWVGWILLCTIPFGLISRSAWGHPRFLNGQVQAWRSSIYAQLWPNEAVKEKVLEDVHMGRLCAREGIRVEVANLSKILAVKMYDTWRQTLDGMSKNSYEITGSGAGSFLLALFLLLVGWAWIGSPPALLLLILSGVFCGAIVRSVGPGLLLMPIVLTIGAYTILRSVVWHKRGTVQWKGRTYG